jgi:hypothetical protein
VGVLVDGTSSVVSMQKMEVDGGRSSWCKVDGRGENWRQSGGWYLSFLLARKACDNAMLLAK